MICFVELETFDACGSYVAGEFQKNCEKASIFRRVEHFTYVPFALFS
jgi:hypothetical protein